MNGKGDTPRPLSVDITTYHDNWDRIFRRPESGSREVEQESLGVPRRGQRVSDDDATSYGK